MRRPTAPLFFAASLILAAGCGGGGGGVPTTPPKVASVNVTLGQAQIEAGLTTFASAQYFDAKQTALSGRVVTYASSAAAVATVDNNGTIVGVTPGSATVSATVEGVSGSTTLTVLQASVGTVSIQQRAPIVRASESLTLTAQTLDRVGQPLTGRTLTWSSADPARATATNAGVITGVSPGSTYIRAVSEGKSDSVLLRVKNLNSPSITGGGPAILVPGDAATITGQNFGTTPNDNAPPCEPDCTVYSDVQLAGPIPVQ